MPEGHTIHRLARDLTAKLGGQRLEASSPQGRFATGAATLDGATLDSVEANGKHLFFHWTDEPLQLHVHLGLFGRFRKRPAPPPPPRGELRLRMVGSSVTFDLSGPTACDLITPDEADGIAARLGPDPLRRDGRSKVFVARVCSSRAAIGTLLLNQAVIAGIGNVYRAEVLHLAGVHPRRLGNTLSEAEAQLIWDLCVSQLRRGVRLNRIVTRDPGEVGQRSAGHIKKADRLYVYKRTNCRRCADALERFDLANRSTWACPTCQTI